MTAGRGDPAPPPPKYHGLQELDRKIDQHLDIDAGFFVEVGGWDGVTYSNTLYFERCRNWRGLLIEPNPIDFLKCRKNRPDAITVCYACVPFDYPDRFVPMTYCASMTVAHSSPGISNQLPDIEAHLSSGEQFLAADEIRFDFGAVAKPLSEILDAEGISVGIDLLVLDVEGYELNVLRGIDFSRHAPRYICVEVWDFDQISDFLIANGYVLVDKLSKHDYLFRLIGENEVARKTS